MSALPAIGRLLAPSPASVARDERVAALYAAHRAQVFALCLHLTASRAEAEDALQETFLAVHRGLCSFRGDAAVSTWIFRIALRAALGIRAQRRHAEPLSVEAADPSPMPDAQAESRIRAGRLLDAMDRLSAEHRAVISLFAVEGLRHAEIAAVLDIPEGTVWSRLHLARKHLAEQMREG
jgi:RNA polymerase sigma-70 factor (ECF subfamily)